MRKFGIPTFLELPNIEDHARLCKELGLQFVELNMNLPQYQPDVIPVETLRRISEEYGIYYTIHLDENFDPFGFNTLVSGAYLETMEQVLKIADTLSIPIINLHLSDGVYFTLPDRKFYLYKQYQEIYLQKVLAFIEGCAQVAGNAEIRICIENTSGFQGFQLKAVELMLQEPLFGLTFDIGHSHCCGNRDEAFFLSHQSRVLHMHFHDANNTKNHLPLGTGEMDLLKYLRFAESCQCGMVLEVKSVLPLKQSVEWLAAVSHGA